MKKGSYSDFKRKRAALEKAALSDLLALLELQSESKAHVTRTLEQVRTAV